MVIGNIRIICLLIQEPGLLFLLLGMGAIMFASLIYVFEKEDPGKNS